jgi:hypothetical protein
MSRLSKLSPAAIKAMFSSETDEQLIMLLTIYDPNGSTDPAAATTPIRLSDNFTKRITATTADNTTITTDSEVIYGVTSRSKDFLFLPMSLNLPTEQDTGVGECSITLNYVTPEAIALIRNHLFSRTKVLIELVVSSNIDHVEASFEEFYITSANYNAESITLSLSMISYNKEPFPSFNFTPSYFPGLF